MSDLHTLLDTAARRPGDAEAVDVSADLTRGERARRRRQATTAARAVCGVGAASMLTVAVVTGVGGSADVAEDGSAVRLVAADLDEGVFSFGRAPAGWELSSQDANHVQFVPAGQPTQSRNYTDNLTVFVDRHGPDGGREVSIGGRVFHVRHVQAPGPDAAPPAPGATWSQESFYSWYTYDHSGDPTVKLFVTFPDDLGWDEATMREFIAAADVSTAAVVHPG